MAEIYGRYYGGGVLELTPNEFKTLPIPYTKTADSDLKKHVSLFEQKNSIENILNQRDEILLECNYSISKQEVKTVQKIYKKLKERRIRG